MRVTYGQKLSYEGTSCSRLSVWMRIYPGLSEAQPQVPELLGGPEARVEHRRITRTAIIGTREPYQDGRSQAQIEGRQRAEGLQGRHHLHVVQEREAREPLVYHAQTGDVQLPLFFLVCHRRE